MNCIVDREVYFTKHLHDAYPAPSQAPADAEGLMQLPNNQTLALVYLVLAIGAQMSPDLPPCEFGDCACGMACTLWVQHSSSQTTKLARGYMTLPARVCH
jgi:hypothetical protein